MEFVETEKVELKRRYTETIEKEIVAFLNTDGGTLYVGVEDDGMVVGVEKVDETFKKISDIITDSILPNAKEYIQLGSKYLDGKIVIEVKVDKGDGLFYIKRFGRSSQGCYRRIGTTCRAMSENEIEKMHSIVLGSKTKITSARGEIQNPTFKYLKLLCSESGLNINDSTFVQNFHLHNESGEWNKMSDLLCDKNDISIKVVRFAGNDKSSKIILRNEYGGKCLVVAMQQALEYCIDVINQTKTEFERGIRKDIQLFDRDAFREVWFNACLHNNWIDGTPPAIYVFCNRIEIVSTGGLPSNLSKDDFFAGVSKPVNDELAKILIRLDMVEQTGHGIPLVTRLYGKSVFEFLDFFIRVSIPFEYDVRNDYIMVDEDSTPCLLNEPYYKYGLEDTTVNLGKKTRDNIMSVLRNNPSLSKAGVARIIGKSSKTVEWHIKKLVDEGLVRHVGANKNGHWEILS